MEARVTLPDGQTWSFTVLLDAQLCSLLHGVARVDK